MHLSICKWPSRLFRLKKRTAACPAAQTISGSQPFWLTLCYRPQLGGKIRRQPRVVTPPYMTPSKIYGIICFWSCTSFHTCLFVFNNCMLIKCENVLCVFLFFLFFYFFLNQTCYWIMNKKSLNILYPSFPLMLSRQSLRLGNSLILHYFLLFFVLFVCFVKSSIYIKSSFLTARHFESSEWVWICSSKNDQSVLVTRHN